MPVEAPAMQRLIEVDGSEMPADVEGQLESALVVDRLTMPDTFTLVFRDPELDVLQRARLEIGVKVAISTALAGDAPEELISGEVTSIEADYDTLGARAVVRGYDLSHRLNAGRKTETYVDATYSDVAQKVARAAGLKAEVDPSGETYKHVLQPNMSDLDFLYSLAKSIGFDCRVEGETLFFKKPTESSTGPSEGDLDTEDPTQLVWSRNLLEFHARMSAVAQVSGVKVRGWDVVAKEAVIGEAPAVATSAQLDLDPAALADKVGGQTLVVVDQPVGSQREADSLATAKAEQVGSSAFEASAVALGSPALKAGVAVSISGVDSALAGKWVISSTRHEFGAGAYRTHLQFSGRLDRSLHGVIANAMPGSSSGAGVRAPGVVIAIVSNIEDPEEMGRIKVKYPWLADVVESGWARFAVPGAGPDSGMVWLPEPGDEVLVAFEMGDFSHPVVIGGLWNGKDKPPLADKLIDNGTVTRRSFVSRKGHKFEFLDADDKSGITVMSSDEKFEVSLDETNGELRIKADGKLVIEAQSLEIKVDTDAKVKATGISLEADGQMKIKGATVALN